MSEVKLGIFNYSSNNFISPSVPKSKTLKKEAPNHCRYDFDGASKPKTLET